MVETLTLNSPITEGFFGHLQKARNYTIRTYLGKPQVCRVESSALEMTPNKLEAVEYGAV